MTSELRKAAEAVIAAQHHMQWNLPTGATEVYLVPCKDRDALSRALSAPSPSIDERAQRAAITIRSEHDLDADAEADVGRIIATEFRDLEASVAEARELLKRAKTFVILDVQLVADFTRFAPLSPEDQHRHDTTESESEKLLPLIDDFLKRTNG